MNADGGGGCSGDGSLGGNDDGGGNDGGVTKSQNSNLSACLSQTDSSMDVVESSPLPSFPSTSTSTSASPLPPPSSSSQIIDSIITSLLSLTALPPGTQCDLPPSHLHTLLHLASLSLTLSPSLVRLAPGVRICGDVHGQYTDLLRLLEYGHHPPRSRYLFLGDYVDRGKQGVETICLLLAYRVKYGDDVTLLRGNHEASGINRIYGFYDEVKRRYSVGMWKRFNAVFSMLPVAAVVGGRVLCMHGGISEEMMRNGLQGIEAIERPCE
ncbi:hypothetical protein TrRE_jg4756, partial [Triparma retinervis]